MPLFPNIKTFSYLLTKPLLCVGLCASAINPCLAGQEQQKAEFAVAYDEYQECVTHKDVECELAKADVALKLGKNIFPPQGKNIANLTGNHAVALMKSSKDKLMVYQNLQLALAVNEGAFGADSEEVLAILNYLHAAQIDLDRKVKAKDTYWLTIKELSAKLYGETSVAHAENLMSVSSIMLLGHTYNKKKALAMAMQAYD